MKEQEDKTQTEKHLKTWDEAIKELQGFIIQSKKEEAKKENKSLKK